MASITAALALLLTPLAIWVMALSVKAGITPPE
jgi:hypothetical protein